RPDEHPGDRQASSHGSSHPASTRRIRSYRRRPRDPLPARALRSIFGQFRSANELGGGPPHSDLARVNVTGTPPCSLPRTPTRLPSSVSSPAKLHGCQFGSSNLSTPSLKATLRSGRSISPRVVPTSFPTTTSSARLVNSSSISR